MPIGLIIVVFVVVGVILWLVNKYVPMPEPMKTVLNIIVAVLLLVWAFDVTGLMNYTLPTHGGR